MNERELFLCSRDRHPSDEAARFVETRVEFGQPRPVFSERSVSFVTGNEALRQQDERALWAEANEDMERLFGLMQQVRKRLSGEKGRDGREMDLQRSNWGEVMEEIQAMAAQRKGSPDKLNKTMVFVDRIGQHSAALESWLELLPMGDYGSSICGAFKLVIGAAGSHTKAEEAGLEALSEIPRVMEHARRYIERYSQMRGQYLEQRTFELFRTIVKMLCHVMQFFADRKSKKLVESFFKQDSYKDELLRCLEEVKKRAQAVNEEAQQAQGQMISDIHETNERLEQMLLCYQRQWEFLLADPRFRLRASETQRLESPARLQVSSYDWANVDHLAPSDDGDTASRASSRRSRVSFEKMQAESETRARAEAEADRDRMLRLLRYDPEELPRDIATSLRFGHRLSNTAKAKAAAMIRHPRFKGFMEEVRRPARLLVNGRDDLAAAEGISPLRVVAAEMARMASGPVPVVAYFCAEHRVPPLVNPGVAPPAASMMASLVGQLLRQLRERGIAADLSFLGESKWERVRRLDVEALCRVFRKLVRQTPGSVLCVVDEVSLYEMQLQSPQTEAAMGRLARLASREGHEGHEGPAVFKLLVTCQDRALGVSRHFAGHCVDLAEVEADDSAEWALSTMALG